MKNELRFSLLAILAIAFSFPARAQQPLKVAKIGWLAPGGNALSPQVELLQREFQKLGYVEGKNLAIERRYADNKLDRLPASADELVSLKVDVIVAASTPAALAAKNATKSIPIVFYSVGDPVQAGLVDSLARPGGNITGLTNIAVDLAGKRLELLKETLPKLTRIAVLWNPRNPASAQQWKESHFPARELGLQLYSMEISSADQHEDSFEAAVKARNAALAVTQDALFVAHQKRIAELAVKNRLPVMYPRADFVTSGGLMSYGADPAESFRRAIVFVDKILKGTRPADIPVEQPKSFEFVVNLQAAKQIGLTIPPNVLVRAGKVIK